MNNVSIDISKSGNILVKTIIDEDTHITKAEIQYLDFFGDAIFTARGKARWNPIDRFDHEIGKGIALGRAWAKYGKKLANHFESLSGSVGEFRAREKRERLIQEYGQVYVAETEFREQLRKQLQRAAEKKESEEEPDVTDLVEQLNSDAPQEPTTALEGEEIIITGTEPLNAVIEENRKKLMGNEESTSNTTIPS